MARSRGTQPAPQAPQDPQFPAQPQPQPHPSQPGQPQPFQQPHQQVPMVPAPKGFVARHKVLTAVLVLVALGVVVQAVSGEGDAAPTAGGVAAGTAQPTAPASAETQAEAPADTPAEPAAEVPAVPGTGTVVADGKLVFTVTSLDPAVASIGDSMFGVTAQGQFVLVHVTVTNVGSEAQYFDSSSQKLLDTQGRTHSADASAAIYLPDSNSFLTSVNPGNTVQGILVFDLPVDAVPASLELHDSPFSGGVTVALG